MIKMNETKNTRKIIKNILVELSLVGLIILVACITLTITVISYGLTESILFGAIIFIVLLLFYFAIWLIVTDTRERKKKKDIILEEEEEDQVILP